MAIDSTSGPQAIHAGLPKRHYNPDEIYSLHVRELAKDRKKADEILRILGYQGSWRGEVNLKGKDGSFFETDLAANLVTGSKGKPICQLGIFEDISELKKTSTPVLNSR